jgi:hypothetical protein
MSPNGKRANDMSVQTASLAKPVAAEFTEKSKTASTFDPASKAQNGKPATDEAIRLGAYLKWEAAGRPEGDGVNFWLETERELLRPK